MMRDARACGYVLLFVLDCLDADFDTGARVSNRVFGAMSRELGSKPD